MDAIERIGRRKKLGISALELEFVEVIEAYSIEALGYCPLPFYELANLLDVSEMCCKSIAKRLIEKDVLGQKSRKLYSKESLLESKESLLESKDCLLESKDCLLESKDCLLESKESLLESKDCLLESKDCLLESKESLLSLKNSSCVRTGLVNNNIINNNKLLLEEEIIKEEKKEKQAKEKNEEKQQEEKPRRKRREQPVPDFPEGYDEELKMAVLEWLEYKIERKEFYTEIGLKTLIKKTLKYQKNDVIQAMETAISNHSQGFYIKSSTYTHPPNQKSVVGKMEHNYNAEREAQEILKRIQEAERLQTWDN